MGYVTIFFFFFFEIKFQPIVSVLDDSFWSSIFGVFFKMRKRNDKVTKKFSTKCSQFDVTMNVNFEFQQPN